MGDLAKIYPFTCVNHHSSCRLALFLAPWEPNLVSVVPLTVAKIETMTSAEPWPGDDPLAVSQRAFHTPRIQPDPISLPQIWL